MPQIAFSLPDGSLAYFEVSPSQLAGPQPAGRVQEAAVSLETALGTVKKTAALLVESVRSAMPERPDELEIEFGLKCSLEVNGFLVAKAASEANYKVKLTWKKGIASA